MNERLTALDTYFLHADRPGLPMLVGSVAFFEAAPLLDGHGRLRLEALRASVTDRLDSLPRLRRKLAWTPGGIARPCWVDDECFDVTAHVDAVEVGGGEDGVRAYAATLFSEILDRDRPLWHLRFVTGFDEGRVALIERVHHSLVDGVSGVDVATVLLDLEPEPPARAPSTWVAPPPPSGAALAGAGVRAAVADPLRLARSSLAAAAHPVRTGRATLTAARAFATVAGDGVFAPPSSLNVPVDGHRALAWIRTDLASVKAAAADAGAGVKVNDVVLGAVAGGLRSLLLGRGEPLRSDLVLKVLVPVSLRGDREHGTLGNRVGALVLPLPVGIGDPDARMRAIAAATARRKARGEAGAADLLLTAADLLPAPLIGPVARSVHRQPLVNLVVTNVPGPPVPLYAMGARMLDVYPFVPLAGNLSLGVAILSYDGGLYVGVSADRDTCPDVETFAAGVRDGFAAVGAAWQPSGALTTTG